MKPTPSILLAGLALLLTCSGFVRVQAQEPLPFLGEIRIFTGNFAPDGWALCDGQLLPINQNQGLFSILGTTYGGNGITHFALPDLRGRVPIHAGEGPGLTNRPLGETGGSATVTVPPATAKVAVKGRRKSYLTAAPGTQSNMQPYLTVNYIVALEGIFPPRS